MKSKLLLVLTAVSLLSFRNVSFGQAPDLGTASDFVLFTTVGAITNSGTNFLTLLTGNVGSNSGGATGFGNVNGVMHNQDGASGTATADLLAAYLELSTTLSTDTIAPALAGDTLPAGVYSIFGSATIDGDLTLDAQGDSNAVFIFQIEAPLSTGVDSKVKLIKGAMACNVFWKVEGLVSMASGTIMKGTVIAHNAAIDMANGVTLQGRALSINGAITTDEVLAYTPIGCGSPILTGPSAPLLASTGCYAIFSANGSLTNAGTSQIIGDVGTNVGLTLGFNALDVTGDIHPIPDGSTAACAADLLVLNNYLDSLTYDIELLKPDLFGHNLVLTPHVYLMLAAVSLTDTLYLNARGNADAVFVFQVFGAFSTTTHAQVILINGAQAGNVYWKVDGAVNISDSSVINGTIVANNGAIDLGTGVELNGSAFTTDGAYQTEAITTSMTPVCVVSGSTSPSANEVVTITPNPFSTSININLGNASQINNCELSIHNILGEEVMHTTVIDQSTTLDTRDLPSGVYFYQFVLSGLKGQSGILVSQQ